MIFPFNTPPPTDTPPPTAASDASIVELDLGLDSASDQMKADLNIDADLGKCADVVCAEGLECMEGVCLCVTGKSCLGCCEGNICRTISANQCAIDNVCLAAGVSKSDDKCQICDPTKSQYQWTLIPCVRTIAGTGVSGFADGFTDTTKSPTAMISYPVGIAVAADGTIYFSDAGNNRIRKLTGGQVSTITGGAVGDSVGPLSSALFDDPESIALDGTGALFVADSNNNKIKMIASGQVTTIAGTTMGDQVGKGTVAQFYWPSGIAADSSGKIYVADTHNHKIKLIQKDPFGEWQVSTFAGIGSAGFKNGTRTAAQFSYPAGLNVDSSGNLYVADRSNYCIRFINITTDLVSTFAGTCRTAGHLDAPATSAKFLGPTDVEVSKQGTVYVADWNGNRVRKISNGQVTTIAGDGTAAHLDGPLSQSKIYAPAELMLDPQGNLIVSESMNEYLRLITSP